MTINGLDISAYQEQPDYGKLINWPALKSDPLISPSSFAGNNIRDSSLSDTIFLRKFYLEIFSRFILLFNFISLRFCEFVVTTTFPTIIFSVPFSALCSHISHILFWRPNEQMLWVATSSVVTCMTNIFKFLKNYIVCNLISSSRGRHKLSIEPECSSTFSGSFPVPTFIFFSNIYFAPKFFFHRNHYILQAKSRCLALFRLLSREAVYTQNGGTLPGKLKTANALDTDIISYWGEYGIS